MFEEKGGREREKKRSREILDEGELGIIHEDNVKRTRNIVF